MKFNNHVLSIITFLAFAFILSSCNQKLYITPINLETFYQKTTGITEKEDAEISKNIFTALIDNTVEKHLPSTKVFSLSGEEYDLAKLIEGKTIIVSSDPYCAAGMASLFEDFPYAQKKLKKELEDVNIICLAIREEEDEYFKRFLSDLQKHYKEIYIIDNEQALAINMVGASRFFVNKKGIVKMMGIGTSSNMEYFTYSVFQGVEKIQ